MAENDILFYLDCNTNFKGLKIPIGKVSKANIARWKRYFKTFKHFFC